LRDIALFLDDLGDNYVGNLDKMPAKNGHVRYLNVVGRKT
jgi:hypothetical protein